MQHLSEWKAKQLVYGQALEEITASFAQGGFIFMPVKGAYLIVTGMSSSIADRKMVDIDLLIPEKAFDKTCNWFATQPSVSEKANYWNFERSFVYNCAGFPIYLEFHRLINFPARFLLPNEALFTRGITHNKSCILPDPTDALLIHVCHMLAHVIDGFNKTACDEIGIYCRQTGFSWENFWKRARATEILPFIWLVIKKWNRINGSNTPAPKAPSLYAALIDRFNLFMRGRHPLVRKLLFEVPFVRNAWWLLWYKVRG